MSEKYLVINGNEYIKTGTIVVPYLARQGKIFVTGCDVPIPDKSVRKISELNDVPESPLDCLKLYHKKVDLTKIEQSIKYRTIDNEDWSGNKCYDQTFRNTIFNQCKFNDTSFHGAKLENVHFLRCDIDILDFRHANLWHVHFLKCGTAYGVKTDHAELVDVWPYDTNMALNYTYTPKVYLEQYDNYPYKGMK